MKYFMLDIETMGIDFENDDIIQIGILEIQKDDNGYYWPNRTFVQTLYTNQKPKTKWIEDNHKELLKISQVSPQYGAEQVRKSILQFFKKCAGQEIPYIMGLNAAMFDVPYLLHKNMLKKADFHYRIYELKGAYNLGEDALQIDPKSLFDKAFDAFPEIEMPDGKNHEALYDCYRQLRCLNGIIRLIRTRMVA